MTVLIADDIAASKKLLRTVLEHTGYQVIEADDGRKALGVLQHEKVDAIVSDILMPRMDGYRFCYEVRLSRDFSQLPFIFYTASFTSPSDEKFALEMGADKFLLKTRPVAAVVEAIRELTTRQRRAFHPKPIGDVNLLKEYTLRMVNRLEQKTAELSSRTEELRREREKAGSASFQSLAQITKLKDALDEHSIVAMTDLRGRITYANDKFCQISGYTREELIGQDHRIINSGHHPKEFIAGLWATILGGGVWRGEIKNKAKNGSFYWVDTTIVPFIDEEDEPRQFVAIRTDITARKMGEESAALLAAIVQSSNDAIISKNLNGYITTWNQGAEKIFGYTAAEMIGKSIMQLIPPDRRDEEGMILARVKRGERVEHFDTVRVAKDGHLVDISVSVSPICDQTGKIIGASKVARDITERNRVLAALNESERQFRTMANAIPQLAWIADADGSIFWYNQRWYDFTGTTPEEMKGWGWQKVHDPEHLPRVLEQWKSALECGEPFEMEFPLRGADGRFGWFLTRVVPVKDAAGRIVRWFGTNTDLSEKREAEEVIRQLNTTLEQKVFERTAELEAANKELEAFSYSVSHDLRAPLRAVDGFSQAVLEDYGQLLPEEGVRDLQTVREGAQRMGCLIDDLLKFSRLSRSPIKSQKVDTAELVRHVLKELSSERKGRQVELRVGELPPCEGDPALLTQVWFNLAANALKYTRQREKAVIEISARQENDECVYFVRDNGAGFDMRYVHKLFGVFQRLHHAHEFEGTGVGLAIVQRIVHRHGGRIWAEGAPDQGATFSFTLRQQKDIV